MDENLRVFLSSLPLRDPNDPKRQFLACQDTFPLVLQKDQLINSLVGFLNRLSPDSINNPCKDNMALLLTAAPYGSGKNTFLSLLCQMFEHKWDVDEFIASLNLDTSKRHYVSTLNGLRILRTHY